MVASVMAIIKELKNEEDRDLFFIPTSKVLSDEDNVIITLWHDQLDNGHHRFVVQKCKRRPWRFSNDVEAQGFVLDEEGNKVDLEQDQLYDFL